MPRSLRIEYPGAVYHALNRGNYRDSIFSLETIKGIFENTLFAACERSGWILHGYCVLDNHYHLALETPEPNLSAGMQWLQATFANRFNRNVQSRGHVFQGRFKSLIVERDEYLGTLLDYIHLNPVRAGIVAPDQLQEYRWSSFWYLFHKRKRPAFMEMSSCLYYAGHLVDTPIGRQKYRSYLGWLVESNNEQADAKFRHICRGWALGTRDFKNILLEKKQVRWIESVGRETEEARHLYWESLLKKLLAHLGKSHSHIVSEKKSAQWKVMIAYYMKKNTLVSNTWLGEHLHMGRPQGVSQYVSAFEKSQGFKTSQYKKMTGRFNT
jgi:REP element-mobilizing transposase RayT